MKLPLRIATLMCDSPLHLTAKKYGSYAGVFAALLEECTVAMKNEVPGIRTGLELTSWDVYRAEEYPNLEDIDAIILTGSRFNAFDDLPWINKLVNFVKTVLAHDRVRIIGVCFGHQILSRALGMTVGRNEKGWEISVLPITLSSTGQRLFKGNSKPHMLSLVQMHRDIVQISRSELPEGVEILGSTAVCQVQGMYKARKFISVQGHPEYTPDIVKEFLEVRKEAGVFTDEMVEDGMRRLEHKHDGVVVGCAFLRFLLE